MSTPPSIAISLHEPEFDREDEALVLETLRSTWVSTGGPFIDRFEAEVARYTGAKHAVSTSSGTVALQLVVEIMAKRQGMTENFDIIVPTMTFIASTNAIVHAGGLPVLVDCAPNSLNLDVSAVTRTIQERYEFSSAKRLWFSRTTRRPLVAVMAVHIHGWACDVIKVREELDRLGVPLIEDAAEALGSRFTKNGEHLGLAGVASALSFNGNKILTTGGGGMIITNDSDFAKKAKHLSTTAKTDGLRFVHDEVGYNFRMVNILAALGCSQLPKLPKRIVRKKELFQRYSSALAGSGITIHKEQGVEPNYWLVTAVFRDRTGREKALMHLNKNNIQARPLWTPVHLQPAYKSLVEAQSFPVAEDLWNRCLSLPSSPQLTDAQISQIAKLILESQA